MIDKKRHVIAMFRSFSKENLSDINVPYKIRILFDEIPDVDMTLLDYDYIGEAKNEDYTEFAKCMSSFVGDSPNSVIILSSACMKDSQLIRKTFNFDMEGYHFSKSLEVHPISISKNVIVFIGIIPIVTHDDIIQAVKWLFSGIYDSHDFMLFSNTPINNDRIMALLKKSLSITTNRYGQIREIDLSVRSIFQNKKELTMFYPYGGTDFGSFMFFIF